MTRWMPMLLLGSLTGCAVLVDVPTPEDVAELEWEDVHSASLDLDWALHVEPVPEQSDVLLDWSNVKTNLLGEGFDLTSVELVMLLQVELPVAEVETLFENNDLDAQDIGLQFLAPTGGVDAIPLAELEILGNPLDPSLLVADESETWLAMLGKQVVGGNSFDVEQAVVLKPDATATASAVSAWSEPPAADLQFAEPIDAILGSRPALDGSAITVDVYGAPFDPFLGDELFLAWYDATPAEVEALAPNLYATAAEVYRAPTLGFARPIELETAVDESGAPFLGFTAEGTWVAGIVCTLCLARTPLALTRIEVRVQLDPLR